MGRSQETFNKKEVRNKKEKKRKEKAEKRLARKDNSKPKSLDDMIAYVDENGMLTSTPPDPSKKQDIEAEDIEIGVPAKSEDGEPDKNTGIVTFYNDSKGYGFITESKNRRSIFFHINNALDDIKEGNRVEYDTEKGPKGLTAVQIKVV